VDARENDLPRAVTHRALSWKAARTLYNLEAAWWPLPSGGGVRTDLAPAAERLLVFRGPREARHAWLLLTWLDWQPLLRHGRRFWQLDAEARAEFLVRLEVAGGLRRRGLGWLRKWLEEARRRGGAQPSAGS